MKLRLKRVYEPYAPADGRRILVDRLWPRGLKKDTARIDLWLKDVAPSNELRKWFAHDPAKWPTFRQRYQDELETNSVAVARLRQELSQGPATLLYGAKDEEHNNAVVLRDYLQALK